MKTCVVILAILLYAGAGLRAGTNTIYFLVSERVKVKTNFDSFALPLDRPEDIEYARRIINNPDEPGLHKVVGVRIIPGGDGINRNYTVAGAPPWSWRVSFLGFGDAVIESAAPSSIERDVNRFIKLYGDIIGFDFYTVTAELGPVLTLVMQEKADQFVFDWNGLLHPSYQYTIEGTESLTPPQWRPLAGASWPTNIHHLVIAKPAVVPRFVRVKAELPKFEFEIPQEPWSADFQMPLP